MRNKAEPGARPAGPQTVMNARHDAREYERLPQHSEAHLNWALIILMARRPTRKKPAPGWAKKPKPAR